MLRSDNKLQNDKMKSSGSEFLHFQTYLGLENKLNSPESLKKIIDKKKEKVKELEAKFTKAVIIKNNAEIVDWNNWSLSRMMVKKRNELQVDVTESTTPSEKVP